MDIQTDCEVAFFVSSSGHCSLDCAYCIVNPIVKHQPTLNFGDIEFLLDSTGKKAFLAFSGKGDFFAGYKKNERLLEKILERNVEAAFDINGVMIHEFPDLPPAALRKIRYLNLAMHFVQLTQKKALEEWEKNALLLICRMQSVNSAAELEKSLQVNFILSPGESAHWEPALIYYEERIFRKTGQKMVLIKDILANFSEDDGSRISRLNERFSHMVKYVKEEDFAARFALHEFVLCPAGSSYFRVWNDGAIQGCPYVSELSDCGNAKNRTFRPTKGLHPCREAKYCDCYAIAVIGKMVFPDQPRLSVGDLT
ncbi:MAG: hypothetical protein Q8O38_16060 [Sulfurimicrobium sp.]|nr:hypothetical protein [Sulfurimicrobium sp.]